MVATLDLAATDRLLTMTVTIMEILMIVVAVETAQNDEITDDGDMIPPRVMAVITLTMAVHLTVVIKGQMLRVSELSYRNLTVRDHGSLGGLTFRIAAHIINGPGETNLHF